MAGTHLDHAKLGAAVLVSSLHKSTSGLIEEVATQLYDYKDKFGRPAPLLSPEVYNFMIAHKDVLNKAINYERDFDYDYFGFKTLERFVR